MMDARDLMVRVDQDRKAVDAEDTAVSTSALEDSATVAIVEQSMGDWTGRYCSILGGTLALLIKLLITLVAVRVFDGLDGMVL